MQFSRENRARSPHFDCVEHDTEWHIRIIICLVEICLFVGWERGRALRASEGWNIRPLKAFYVTEMNTFVPNNSEASVRCPKAHDCWSNKERPKQNKTNSRILLLPIFYCICFRFNTFRHNVGIVNGKMCRFSRSCSNNAWLAIFCNNCTIITFFVDVLWPFHQLIV